MKVAGVQHDVAWEDRTATLARIEPQLAAAAGAGARLVVLTEMFPTGFSMVPERVAEPEGGPSTEFLRTQAADLGVWVAGSVPIVPEVGGRPVNRFLLAGPGGELEHYDKIHPFTYSGEHERYAAGSRRVTFAVEGVRVTPFVCYDLRFADDFWAMADGTDCYVVVANWPAARRTHWQALLVARAIENQAYVVGVNRVGEGGGLHYAGDSRIIDPLGEVLAGGAGGETILLADVDPAMVAETRKRYPFLADRVRP
ncbi:MAG TPA: nitrilase-related carbon-nitrogen hydrolase [Acidimicrobiia bacterium]|nr:nitrilase-related carbon-nitrogen hydrolase [Acidimicrobiia bacterium]